MSDPGKIDRTPEELPAVKTTIVGGRPPGSGKMLGAIPRGIEVLVKKAAVDPQFRALLLNERSKAALAIGLRLEAAEAMMLDIVPAAQLEMIIANTRVDPAKMPAFLGKAAAVMLVALGVTSMDCGQAYSAGVTPGRDGAAATAPATQSSTAPTLAPDTGSSRGIRPDVPMTQGIRPDEVKRTTAPATAPSTSPATAPATRPIDPNYEPLTKGMRADIPPGVILDMQGGPGDGPNAVQMAGARADVPQVPPAQRVEASTQPATAPATAPSTAPSLPVSRGIRPDVPSTAPATMPATRPATQPATRPATRPVATAPGNEPVRPPIRIAGIRAEPPVQPPVAEPPPLSTQPRPLSDKELADLVAQLDSDEWKVRDLAQRQLLDHGTFILEQLKAAQKSDKLSLEQTNRLKNIVEKIEQRLRTPPATPPQPLPRVVVGIMPMERD